MERLRNIQGYVISQFLSGFCLNKLDLINDVGFDNYYKTIYLAIKKQYVELGEIDLTTIGFDFNRAVDIINEFGYLSLNIDKCIQQINENAYNKRVDEIANALKLKRIEPNEAITFLSELNKVDYANVYDVSKLKYDPLNIKTDTIETGIYLYDKHVEDWKKGDLTVLFGRNGEGKTSIISQVIGHNLSRKVKTFLYSGEMSDDKIQSWLYHQIVGQDKDAYITVQTKYGNKKELKQNVIEAIKEWHKDSFYLYNRNSKRTIRELDRLFVTMESCVKSGVVLFIIDNLMTVLEENADSLYSDQANFVQRCKDFAVKNKVHIVLVAHPHKEKKEITADKGNLEKTDISGSNNIPNKADNIIAAERVWNDEIPIDLILTSLKDRESGQRKVIPMRFSKETKRFYDATTPQNVNYGWKKFLKPEPKTVEFYNGEKQTFEDGEFDEMFFKDH